MVLLMAVVLHGLEDLLVSLYKQVDAALTDIDMVSEEVGVGSTAQTDVPSFDCFVT
jgi:hypothetical protein